MTPDDQPPGPLEPRHLPPRTPAPPPEIRRPERVVLAQELGAAEAPARPKRDRRGMIVAAVAVFSMLTGIGLAAGTYYFDSVPTPDQLELPESTTVYFADGSTPMAKLGTENRTLLKLDEMTESVKQAVVAAEDQTFWTNEGIDFRGVLRAAWNNLTGGDTQGASTITQQYARVAAELTGVTYSRKLREAVIAWKLDDKFDKHEILEFYLNTVPFGRGAYGIEAAAQSFMGKSANVHAPADQQLTTEEAMVLIAMIKQPEANPDDPEGAPGYDPTRSPKAKQNSIDRWNYIRQAMVDVGYLTQAEADAMVYPESVQPYDPSVHQSGLDLPTGLVVSHALSELRQTEQFRDKPKDYIANGGFRIITTIDKRAQDAAEAAADIRRETAPKEVRGQPANWQAALVAVEPGTGRVLAYYGGSNGAGADFAGWFYDENGVARGFGAHPPGSTFKVYDIAEALRRNISLDTVYDAPPTKEFPASGRTKGSEAGPVRNAGTAECQPSCTLVQATVASLNVPFFELTEQLGAPAVIEMAARAGIDHMWANQAEDARTDLRGKPGTEVSPSRFSTEVGIGQYPVTVTDHANGLATMAAGGKRAQAHFVRAVEKDGDLVYGEQLTQAEIGLTADQIAQLNATLVQVQPGRFSDDWDSAGKTGTWQHGDSTTENAHVWMVGYTRALAAAVWVGTSDGEALKTASGRTNVFGSSHAAPIWRQFMRSATEAMQFDEGLRRFDKPSAPPTSTPDPTPEPTAEPEPTPDATPPPTKEPPPTVVPTLPTTTTTTVTLPAITPTNGPGGQGLTPPPPRLGRRSRG